MAQNTNNNTGKVILVVGAILLLGGLAYGLIRKSGSDEGSAAEPSTPEPIEPTPTPNGGGGGSSVGTGSPNKTYAATPFKSNAEGDTFRLYVNRVHPDWAKEHDLDPSGSYDNSYIRMAWYYFGNEYKYAVKPIIDKAKKTYSSTVPGQGGAPQTVVNMAQIRQKYPEYAWYLNVA